MSPLRTAVAIFAGAMLLLIVPQTLELTLVHALADAPPPDEAAYLAVRNRPGVLAVTVVTHGLSAMLVGYVLGRIAGAQEVRHAIGTAVIIITLHLLSFFSDNVMLPPLWVRVAVLIVMPPALIAGAKVRADARAIQLEQAGGGRPEERS